MNDLLTEQHEAITGLAADLLQFARGVTAPPAQTGIPATLVESPGAPCTWEEIRVLDAGAVEEAIPVLRENCNLRYLEQFRLLRTQLLLQRSRLAPDYDFRCVTLLSTVAGEGKTFTASNLAATLAASSGQAPGKVLLIEANTLAPDFHNSLACGEGAGLAQALNRPESWMRSILRHPALPLYVMPLGKPMSGAVVNFEPLPELFRLFRSEFEWVIVDGVSFSLSPDAQWLAAQADGALLVVHEGMPPFSLVQDTLKRIPPERMVGVVMNQRKPSRPVFRWKVRLSR